MKNKKSKGFTLIELLVVIAIIGLLASVVTTSLARARMRARDAKRVVDLKNFMKAMELYYNVNDHYPIYGGADTTYALETVASLAVPPIDTNYISEVPFDPINSPTRRYFYAYSNSGKDYGLRVNFEDGGTCKYRTSGAPSTLFGASVVDCTR